MTSATAQSRKPDLRSYYRTKLPAVDPGSLSWQVLLTRGTASVLALDPVAESWDWSEDDGTGLTANLSLRRPDAEDPGSLPVGRGQRVTLRVRWGGVWYELWSMRTKSPDTGLDGATSVELGDPFDRLRRTSRTYRYRKDAAHPRGWFAHEIAVDVARRGGFELGEVASGTYHIPRLVEEEADPIWVLRQAYTKETDHSGRRFLFRVSRDRLDILPFERNDTIFVIDGGAHTFRYQKVGNPRPVTVLTGRGKLGKGKSAEKIEHTSFHREVVHRFGYVHADRDFGRVASVAELRAKVQRALAAAIRVQWTVTTEIPLTPFIRRGHGVLVNLPREGFSGGRSFMYVSSVQHSVQQGSYATSLELVEADPYQRYRDDLDRKAREKKRRDRKQRSRT